jgi:riboflavin kinase/FMN adenylyltransferase
VVAVTFNPHPVAVLAPAKTPPLLTRIERRAQLLVAAGASHVLALPFDRQMADWSPEEFVQRVLVQALHSQAVVVGENFRFGHRAAGSIDTLARLGTEHGFSLHALPLDGADEAWSSTLIRRSLAEGDVERAADALGRLFAIDGVVVRGDQRGRQLGYPTANVPTPADLAVPADGVYAGWLRRIDDPSAQPLPAAISVGTNPTFNGIEHRVESYVLDRDDLELYDVPVEVSFVRRLRGQVRFHSVEALIEQMDADCDAARTLLTDAG